MSIYNDGTYLNQNPTWGIEDSIWKASNILRLIERNNIEFTSYTEVGCGAGRVIHQLSTKYPTAVFHGYDISPQAIDLAKQHGAPNLTYFNKDILGEKEQHYDVIALIDVIEHIEDHRTFLRQIKEIGETFIFTIPLEITVSSVLRNVMKNSRESVGHLHFFMKDTALSTLLDTGYEIIDYFYTRAGLDNATKFKSKIAWLPRKILFAINEDACARILGGFPLIVLAK